MIYEYNCGNCTKIFDVVKPVSLFDREENCPKCNSLMIRAFAPAKIHLYNTAVQEKVYQPALGKAATNSELKREADRRGWVELGNENPYKHLKPETSSYDF